MTVGVPVELPKTAALKILRRQLADEARERILAQRAEKNLPHDS